MYQINAVTTSYPHFKLTPPAKVEVLVCGDMTCHLCGADEQNRLWEKALDKIENETYSLREVSCLGRCEEGPVVLFNGRGYGKLEGNQIEELIKNQGSDNPEKPTHNADSASNYEIDPYEGCDDFRALENAMKDKHPQLIIDELKKSGLRGMGGAGFPTGTKWEIVRNERGAEKYVICNADESEPGTFKDRFLIEHFPDLVVEGIVISGYVVGAGKGYVFIRHEYEQQRILLEDAIERCKSRGLIGNAILGTDFRFDLEIFESPGGYICGEETALLEAMEGKRAEPRNKPPFPGTVGLYGKPTLINNVETFGFVPSILLKGGEWFKTKGRNGANGLKFLALSGHVKKPGVYEVPLGIKTSEFISDYGGGVSENGTLKAFAPGGASSGFLPGTMADVPLDFQSLAKAGSMLGSGAVVVVKEGTCMLDLALNVEKFFRNESCGKCVPCREGTQRIVDIFTRASKGRTSQNEFDLISELSETMMLTSICGLGQAAPNPILSVLKYFKDEVLAHVTKKECPSGICFNLGLEK
jgi:NADH:ubiquinone oxidoreductase subunit F (NADH-binding)